MENFFREIDLFYFTVFLSEHQEHFGGNDEPETTLSEINFTEKFQSAIIKDKVQKEIFILEKDDAKCQICKTETFSSYDYYIENPTNVALCEDCLVLYSGHENYQKVQKFVKSLFTKKNCKKGSI